MHRRAALALAALACTAASPRTLASGDDAVVVIRGSSVSVARPLTPERVLDGSAEVEIVRIEAAPAPVARPRLPEPEREVVIVYLPVAEPPPPIGIPVAWTAAWPWAGKPGFHPHGPHAGPHRQGHFPPGFHPLGLHRAPVRNALHRR